MSKRIHLLELKELHKKNPSEFIASGEFCWHHSSSTRLGKGAFGEVFLGYNDQDSFQVAVKIVKEDFYTKERKVYINLKREIKIMEELVACEFVVRLLQVEEQKGLGMILVMEICDCDLEDFLKKNQITESQFRRFLKQLSIGINAMHNLSIVHRDLKPQNILLKFPGSDRRGRGQDPSPEWDMRLADFGYSRFYKEQLEGEVTNKNIDMESLAGTPVFMAPEALYCVMYPGGSYDHTVDIWSVGALLYRVLVGKCGFFAPIQDILSILQKKGDAIAFTRASRKTTYIRELPPDVDDILTPVFKEKMTWLIKECLRVEASARISYDTFYQVVDDLVQTKIQLVSVHSGLESKVAYGDKPLLLTDLQRQIAADFGIQADSLIILRDTSLPEATISTQTALEAFINFSRSQQFGGSGRDPNLFLLDQSVLSRMDPPPLQLLAYQDLSEFLKAPERIEEVRTRDNSHYVPHLCSKLLKDIELTGESQVAGMGAYAQFALGARERHKGLRVRFNEDFSPLRVRLTSLGAQLRTYGAALGQSGYTAEAASFRELVREAETVREFLDEAAAEIDADVLRRHTALVSDAERAPALCVRELIRPLHSDCRGLKRLPVSEQLARVGALRTSVENRHMDLNAQIHYRLNANNATLRQFEASQQALLALSKEIKETHSVNVEAISSKLQGTLLSVIQAPDALTTGTGADSQEQNRRLQLRVSEVERENSQLIENSARHKRETEQLIGQLDKERVGKPMMENIIVSANAKIAECSAWLNWLKGTLGVAEAPPEAGSLDEFQTAEWEPALGAVCRELSRSVQRCPTGTLERMRTEVGRKLAGEEQKDPMCARFNVADFRKGDYVLFLPTKQMGPYKSVPKAFCIDNKQYFLNRDCYEAFKLREDQSLSTWLLGQATEDPVKETARHVCQYPAGRTGTEFFTMRANFYFAPAAKPSV